MAFETLKGIVLKYADYKENDRILTLLTRERGLVSLTARGVRTGKKANASAVKDAYCCGEFVVYERNRMLYVSSSSLIEAFYPIREDYDRLTAAAQIARMAEKAASNEKNEPLFSLVYHSLSFLAYSKVEPVDLVLAFASKLIVVEGYEPLITRCSVCGRSVLSESSIRFSNSHGGSVCSECAGDEPTYSPSSMEAFRRMILLEPREMDRVRLTEAMRSELNKLLIDYIEFSFEQPVRLKNHNNRTNDPK